jgi:UDP:flavonoid glycosyltransferase YjiC (YdhE family)
MFKTEAWWTMPLKTIKYSQRLGDVLRCLPACKYLADQGHEVFFDCLAQYHGVFEMTSYVKAGHRQGDVLDLEVWPDKYEAYRNSNKTWTDFVYSHPEIEKADNKNIILDLLNESSAEGLPESYNLVAPFGISQGHKRSPFEVIVEARKKLGDKNFVILCPPEIKINGLMCYTANSVEQMAKAIRGANEFWCIDSAPMAIAKAVRKEKKVVYYRQTLEPFDKDNNEIWDTVELA